jgi:hypothetical protein
LDGLAEPPAIMPHDLGRPRLPRHDPHMMVLTAIRAWCAGHKKLTMALVGAAVALIPTTVLDDDRKKWVVELVIAYLVGQGIADNGKEAAKIQKGLA